MFHPALLNSAKKSAPAQASPTLASEQEALLAVYVLRKISLKKNEHSAIYTESIEDISLIADIIKRATEVFGNKEKAQQWLSKPLSVFQKKSPLQYAETKEGADFVLDLLGRIEYGVFS